MKHLPKHLQPRWRYLAVESTTWPDHALERDVFQRELYYSAQNLLGDAGSAQLDLSVVRFRTSDGGCEAVVRVYRGHVSAARAALACLGSIAGSPIGIRIRGVSGTIRACEEKYMGRGLQQREERDVVFENANRTAHCFDGRADIRVGDAFVGATTLDFE